MLVWSYCLQQGQATLGYHSGREQCQYTLGWKPFVPPDVLTYFYSLSSSHRPSLPISVPIPQKYKYQQVPTQLNVLTYFYYYHSHHRMCSARWQTEGFFYPSINSKTSTLTRWPMPSSIIWGHQLVKVEISTMFECLIFREKTYFPSEG